MACGSSDPNDKKWRCPGCTYLNWPRAQRCVQCYTKKDADSILNLNEQQFRSLSIYDDDVIGSDHLRRHQQQQASNDSKTIEQAYVGSPVTNNKLSSSPYSSRTNLASSAATAAARNKLNTLSSSNASGGIGGAVNLGGSDAIASRLNSVSPVGGGGGVENRAACAIVGGKWSCHVCTFENWPRSLKCSMCGHNKDGKDIPTTTTSCDGSGVGGGIGAATNHFNLQRGGAGLYIKSGNSSPDREYDDNLATNYINRSNNKRNNSSYRYQLSMGCPHPRLGN